jgi:hypothetical protein
LVVDIAVFTPIVASANVIAYLNSDGAVSGLAAVSFKSYELI